MALGRGDAEAVDAWFAEYKNIPSSDVNNLAKHFSSIGHFSQVVWKSTTAVGCDNYVCPNPFVISGGSPKNKYQNVAMATCEYSPAGNVGGMYSFDVPPDMVTSLLQSRQSRP